MSNQLLRKNKIVGAQLRSDIPDFRAGTVVEVHYKIKEGGKERVQVFKGIVTSVKGGRTINATFTVLKNSTARVKVERTFPLHSPLIDKIVLVSSNQRGRSNKMYHLNNLKEPIKSANVRPVKVK